MTRLALIPLFILLALVIGSLLALIFQLDLTTLGHILFEPELHFALLLSLITAATALLLSLLLGVPAAWALVRQPLPAKRLVTLLLDLPLVMPPLVVGMGLLLLLGQQGPLSAVVPQISRLLFSPLGIVIAQTYVASAIVLRSASAAFSALDPAYVTTAFNLGLSPVRTFLLVEIPLCRQALLSGAVLALARALGEFGATLMLAGMVRMKTETLPMAIFLNISSDDFPLAVGCALLLMLLACVLLLVLQWLNPPAGRVYAGN